MSNIIGIDGKPVENEATVAEESEVEKLMSGKLRNDADLMLDVWRCYYLVRASMIHNSDGKITPDMFQEISTALGSIAADGFDASKLRKRIKNNLVKFLGRMANGQFNALAAEKQSAKTAKESNDDGVQQDTDTGGEEEN